MLGRDNFKVRKQIFLRMHVHRIQSIRIADCHALRISHGNAFEFRFINTVPLRSIVPDVCKKALVNVHFTAESVVNRKIRVAAFIGSARHRQIQIALHRERIISRETAARDLDFGTVESGIARHSAGFFGFESSSADQKSAACHIAAAIYAAESTAADFDGRFRGTENTDCPTASRVSNKTAALAVGNRQPAALDRNQSVNPDIPFDGMSV